MRNKQNDELAVCGMSAVKKLEKNNWQQIRRLYFTQEVAPLFGGLCKKLAENHGIYNVVKSSDLEKLSGTVHHQGVVAMMHMPHIIPLDSDIVDSWIANGENALVLDHIGNANNFGAIVRSAAFFGMKHIVTANDESQSLVTTSSYRIAEGGMEFVNIYSVRSIARLLEAVNGRMARIGTDLHAKKSVAEITVLCNRKPALVVLGNEETGISETARTNCDECVVIPYADMGNGEAAVQSLNVAQAASVILYELMKQK
ncbi:MAG: RNA methyltransferase [Treponema sp.]|nr:RNA methyltransferase [Treponema sp.]